ncbi:M48 family metallopeptidase [Hoyosella sp. YIM 151337]|uniref:M48 metallopeptidase family protein n=1 Tax=Hoyosella sp. YIM 151337 TaxID=2992742 RepID=UPI00223576A9|nr:M48 family metallopeptidase [Hoyosella sp. YIM 151337]MCW4352252.1 M48 family metallopeptidase [Hoyosella sp. YIM 151337]
MSDGSRRARSAAPSPVNAGSSQTAGTQTIPRDEPKLRQEAHSSSAYDTAEIEIRRSPRRRKTISARREGNRIVVLVPSGLSESTEAELVERMVTKLRKADDRRDTDRGRDNARLAERARQLSWRWLDGAAEPVSVRWVPAMRTRWASCTPEDGTIRVSTLLRAVPDYVLDYVLVHELVHLIVPGGHPPEFWEQVYRFPRTERAIGFLEAYSRMSTAKTDGADEAAECDDDDRAIAAER